MHQEGMVLRWVMHGEGPSARKAKLFPNQPEEFGRVVTDQTRPVTLGFAHPWQAELEGGARYYYNHYTQESTWDMPAEIVALLRSRGEIQNGAVGGAAAGNVPGGLVDTPTAGRGGLVGFTQLRVEIDRLDFTNPADGKAIDTMVRSHGVCF